jgi:Ca-activated chloride channel family protein
MLKRSFLSILILAFAGFAMIPTAPCQLEGTISDINTGEKMLFTNVSLLNKKDSVPVASVSTDINGTFCFSNIPAGIYLVEAKSLGYEIKYQQVIVTESAQQIEMKMIVSDKNLKEIEVGNVSFNSQLTTLPGVMAYQSGRYGKKHKYRSVSGSRFTEGEANTEEYSRINDNEFKSCQKDPLSTFSIDVDKAAYSNVRRYLSKGQMPPPDAVRSEEMINYFPYDYPQPASQNPFSIVSEYTDCPWNKAHQLVHIGIQGKIITKENLIAHNLVFLIDVSGSMSSPDKLPLVKDGIRLLVEELRPQDKVSIVVYAGAAGMVLAPTSDKQKIKEALNKLEAGGSTAGGEGIELAYKIAKENFIKEGNNRIILATDGDFNVGVSSEGDLTRLIEKKREEGVFLTVLGFGTGNYKDSRMEQLADKGNGNYFYVDNLLEAKKTFVKELSGTLFTIAKDVKIQLEFNPAYVKAYRLIGYENRALADEDFNDDKKDAGELGAGHSVTALYEIIPAGSTEEIKSVDSLKYSKGKNVSSTGALNEELFTVKFRYKLPKEKESVLITHVQKSTKKSFDLASDNLRFASAVASFGMLLRDSEFKKDLTYRDVISIAKSSKGKDDDGYRAEFIRLAEVAELLSAAAQNK